MTEHQWLSETNPFRLIDFVGGRLSDRKGALFGCACCRIIWYLLVERDTRRAIEVTERFENGEVSKRARVLAARKARIMMHKADQTYLQTPEGLPSMAAHARALATHAAATLATTGYYRHLVHQILDAFSMEQVATDSRPLHTGERVCAALRDIVGNPFRAQVVQGWGAACNDLAAGIVRSAGFDRLPILADALEDAGCTDAEILNHCRQPGEHWRGCWVVDLILGKQ
jgi:hypothetical protein